MSTEDLVDDGSDNDKTNGFVAAIGRLAGSEAVELTRLGGGDVAQSFRCRLADGSTVFAKTHHDPPPGFFTTEALGLEWLRASDTVAVPRVIGHADNPPVLVLEWIDEAALAPDDEAFGRALAALHRTGAERFGREDGRTTGSRRLPNVPCDTWVEFYATRRLLPLSRLAADADALPTDVIAGLEAVAGRLGDVGGPPEPPARLHGDLWAGNRIVDATGGSWLIDPACHGGHREFDLAMMRLFGGFSERCHQAYGEAAPLADGWQERVPLHQLAPLAVHAIKFGGGYVRATAEAVARYR